MMCQYDGVSPVCPRCVTSVSPVCPQCHQCPQSLITILNITRMSEARTLILTNLQFMDTSQGAIDSIFSSPISLALFVEGSQVVAQQIGQSTKSVTLWPDKSLPSINLPPTLLKFELEIRIFKDEQFYGTGTSHLMFGIDKKQILNVLNSDAYMVGKVVYEVDWNGGGYKRKIKTEPTYKKRADDDQYGCFSCFSGKQKKREKIKEITQTKVKLDYVNKAIVYNIDQLEKGVDNTEIPLKIQFYSH